MDSDGDLQMKFFKKKKKNPDAVNNFNNKVVKKDQHHNDKPKMIHSKVHKKKDRKKLPAFMCKVSDYLFLYWSVFKIFLSNAGLPRILLNKEFE